MNRATRNTLLGGAGLAALFAAATLKLDLTDPASAAKLICTRASDAYCDDQFGNWLKFLPNIPRITNKGLLPEEARTNSLRNNSMQGASAPSTLPTNWLSSLNGTAAVTVIGTGTENGIDYVDLRFTGADAAATWSIHFEALTQIVAADAQTWTGSFFIKLVGGSLTNIPVNNRVVFRTAAGAVVTVQDVAAVPTSAGLSSQRLTNTFLAAGGTIARITNSLSSGTPTGAYDITLRIGWPQLELGASVTSPIRTTLAAATRAADVIVPNPQPTFGAAYSLFAEGSPNAPTTYGANQTIFAVDAAGDANNRTYMLRASATGVDFAAIIDGSVAQMSTTTGVAWATGATKKIAVALENGSQASALSGAIVGTATGTMPDTPTACRIGTNSANTTQWNGYIRRVAYWPRRLTNAELQLLTRI